MSLHCLLLPFHQQLLSSMISLLFGCWAVMIELDGPSQRDCWRLVIAPVSCCLGLSAIKWPPCTKLFTLYSHFAVHWCRYESRLWSIGELIWIDESRQSKHSLCLLAEMFCYFSVWHHQGPDVNQFIDVHLLALAAGADELCRLFLILGFSLLGLSDRHFTLFFLPSTR